MSNKRRPPPEGATRPRASRRGARPLFTRLALRLGRTVVGVLPHSRRIPAANDPEA